MYQRKKNKKPITIILEDFINETTDKDKYAQKYNHSISAAQGDKEFANKLKKMKIRTGRFSLRKEILNNPWLTKRPASQALKWLFREVFKDPKNYKYTKRLLYQGGLFIFEYHNPKYKDTSILPWFDKFPLVLSLGPRVYQTGIRNLGFNLHILPPGIRIITLCYIFELYKKTYRFGVYYQKDIHPVAVEYESIMKVLKPYGVGFSVRMYIPQRQTQIVHFTPKDWHKAIFIPSRGYYDIKAKKLIKEWREYCKNNKLTINERVNWKSLI
jgi:hypothetical protein